MIISAMLDSREPPQLNDQLTKRLDCPCVVAPLPCGDVWLNVVDGQQIIVERKTIPDLLGSIDDGRLFNQAAEINAITKWGFVVVAEMPRVIGGRIQTDNGLTKWEWASVQGALLTVQDLGLGVAFCEPHDYPGMLIRIAARDTRAVKVAPRRPAIKATEQEKILMSFPRIGHARAQTLLALGGDIGGVWYLLFNDPEQTAVKRGVLGAKELETIRNLVFSMEEKDE